MKDSTRALRRATVVALAAIIAGAFWTTFTAGNAVAIRSGIDPGQAWVWPIMLDVQAAVAGVVAEAVAKPRSAVRRYAWTLMGIDSALSLGGNVLHLVLPPDAPMPMVVPFVVACIPPMTMVTAVHLFLLARHTTPVVSCADSVHLDGAPLGLVPIEDDAPGAAPLELVSGAPLDAPVVRQPRLVRAAQDRPARVTESVSGAPRALRVAPDDFANWYTTWCTTHDGEPTRAEIADRFGCSKSTAGRALAQYLAAHHG